MKKYSFVPGIKAGVLTGMGFVALTMSAGAQTAAPADATAPTAGASVPTQQMSNDVPLIPEKKVKGKDDKVVQSKDTKKELRKEKKVNPLVGQDAKLPDKQLFDKATEATKHGHFDVARLDLQTLLNTYPDSQYQMQAKLAIADSWYREGGTAALTQAESEYADFRVFFPNAPEAAEAQMRIGDIYFRQMDKPDRDYSKAVHAEEEYRRMLTDYPDSTLVPAAQQRLREVQEALANRESEVAGYYAAKNNWPATIARYKTVADTYPQYSHMDDVLIGMGDAYEAEARYVRGLKLPEAGKARLEQTYDGLAAAAYRQVVLEHSASPHVDDAKDRLLAMNLPVPTPTPEQVAASAALENSRAQYRLKDRATLLFMHQPDVVSAARIGDPPLVDAKPTLAPQVSRQIYADYSAAMNPNAAAAAPAANTPGAADNTTASTAAAAPAVPAGPLQLQEVPTAGNGSSTSDVITTTPADSSRPAGNSLGVEVLSTHGAAANDPNNPNNQLMPATPANAAPLPAIEKAAEAPDAVNEAAGQTTPAGQTPNPNGKKGKPDADKDGSDSKHHKKKGLAKLNPF
jgi:outer membrane protein assembly factor BamD